MVRFWHGLLTDQLLRRTSLDTMLSRLYPMFQGQVSFYGLGVLVNDLPGPRPDTWVGHSGGTPEIRAEVSFSLERKAFAAAALTNNGSAQATMNLLFQALETEPAAEPSAAAPQP